MIHSKVLKLLTMICASLAFVNSSNELAEHEVDISELFTNIAQQCQININAEMEDEGSPLAWCLLNVLQNQGKQCIVKAFHIFYYGEEIYQGNQGQGLTTTLAPNVFESAEKYINDHCSMDETQHEQLSCVLEQLSTQSCESIEAVIPSAQTGNKPNTEDPFVPIDPSTDNPTSIKQETPISISLDDNLGQKYDKSPERGDARIVQPTSILTLSLIVYCNCLVSYQGA